ncbi:MAG TPA: hypothetical protein VMD09_11315 [Solirubrobacteraceae bacterium]|nr:hypothetical protein [Solirubrobacteraceae bacterium]
MWKLRVSILVTSGVLALGLSSAAWATSGLHANAEGGGSASAGGSNSCGEYIATRGDGGTTSSGADTPCVTTTSIGGIKTSIGAVTASRREAHSARKRHGLGRPVRHRRGGKRHGSAVTVAAVTG